jgi:hypothetical protein
MNDAADALSAALERRDISAACAASQEQLRLHRALGVLKWEASAPRAAVHGHDWRNDGVWWRTCGRCGLRVSSVVEGGTRVRTVQTVSFAEDGLPNDRGTATVVASAAPVPPCSNGEVGVYATYGAVAPWGHS